MKIRSILVLAALCLAGFGLAFAADNVNMGMWKLNESKSKIAAGMPKNTTVTYTADGDNIKVTTDGTDADGKPTHTEWTGKFDGKDYPVTGDPNSDARSYKQVDDHTLMLENKKGGQVTMSGKIVVSADGKSRTVTVKGKDSKGKEMSGTAVYDKQ
jgi:hypothetical protein